MDNNELVLSRLSDDILLRGLSKNTLESYTIRARIFEVLTREEVSAIITGCDNLKHKAMLMVIYSAGLRVSEAATLKIQHIDSKAMRIFVACGKGGKDRYTLLSDVCLYALRDYWKMYRPPHREGWLFLSTYDVTHITSTGIRYAFNEAVKRTAIVKDVSVQAAAETLTELSADKTYLGAQIGFTAILHTWGQNLMHHPHLHCIVPGGGLDSSGKWVNSRKKFFIPVKVLSRKFRASFYTI